MWCWVREDCRVRGWGLYAELWHFYGVPVGSDGSVIRFGAGRNGVYWTEWIRS